MFAGRRPFVSFEIIGNNLGAISNLVQNAMNIYRRDGLKQPVMKWNCVHIAYTNEVKFQGVIVDKRLKFNAKKPE